MSSILLANSPKALDNSINLSVLLTSIELTSLTSLATPFEALSNFDNFCNLPGLIPLNFSIKSEKLDIAVEVSLTLENSLTLSYKIKGCI